MTGCRASPVVLARNGAEAGRGGCDEAKLGVDPNVGAGWAVGIVKGVPEDGDEEGPEPKKFG